MSSHGSDVASAVKPRGDASRSPLDSESTTKPVLPEKGTIVDAVPGPPIFEEKRKVPELEGEETDIIEVTSEGRTDLPGLLQYLDNMQRDDIRISEATFIINTWYFGGLIPLNHHGFVFALTDHDGTAEYLTLDFGRQGIVWDIFDDFPAFPDGTILTERYAIDSDMKPLKSYCQETKPFNYFTNDCSLWATGLMQRLKMVEADRGEVRPNSRIKVRHNNRGVLGFALCN
mmetsp:Transcript_85888/g.148714  ORF Transcript_85888/g.148714 Transcript_85888/m.148714 type:complete len:230 (+) Transcript_85888:81-770(+)